MGIIRIILILKCKRVNNLFIKIKVEIKWILIFCNKINVVVKIILIIVEWMFFNAVWIVDEFLICYSKLE